MVVATMSAHPSIRPEIRHRRTTHHGISAGTAKKATAAIDDPVRLYLLQMGGIPLLSRDTEVSNAKQIELWRRRFRRTLLGNEFVLAGAVRLLEKVRDGAVRLDRTIEVSVTNTAEKKRMLRRMGPNLETLRRLEQEKKTLFRIAMSRSAPLKPAPGADRSARASREGSDRAPRCR